MTFKYIAAPFLLFFGISLHAQILVDGYYITLKGDSVYTEVRLPRQLFSGVAKGKLAQNVRLTSSQDVDYERMQARQLKGYGFTYQGRQYDFVAVEGSSGKVRFYEQVVGGPSVFLYTYGKPGRRRKSDRFVIRRANGKSLTLTGSMATDEIRTQLYQFFSDNPAWRPVIDAGRISKSHLNDSLRDLVLALNHV
jgi:hypothetical protein